ncbi:MAG: alpha/beta fold hydrolase [Chloroflexi bacterium]|nr:alpha/beta fold hydrolase [Chloroflexota bacterium]
MTDSRTLEVPGGTINYEVVGDGPALTLIHAGIAHLRMWDEHIPAFTRRYRVIRYDTRGFGRTRSDDVEFSNRGDLLALLDHLGVERTHLLGISRGGSIALDFTLEHPERVSALIVVASSPGGFEHEAPEMDARWAELERLEDAKDWVPLVEAETQVWVDGPGQPSDRVDPDVRLRMTRWNLENYRAEGGNGRPQPLEPRAVDRLAEVAAPTLVMWGDLDEPGVPAGSKLMASAIPGARSHLFPGVAHMVDLERPREFEQVVLDFLAEVDRSLEAVSLATS